MENPHSHIRSAAQENERDHQVASAKHAERAERQRGEPKKTRLIDLTALRFGSLTVIERGEDHIVKNGVKPTWRCICDCGVETSVRGVYLRSGRQKSCGCERKTHGMTGTPVYKAWQGMIQRCTNPYDDHWMHYGGRGIEVCEAWMLSFEQFFADVGEKPDPSYSLDRINVDGNYEPGNVRWATAKQQTNNRRISDSYGFNKYQAAAGKTAIYPHRTSFHGLVYTGLGLAGEAGEISNKLAKIIRDDKGEVSAEARDGLIDEVGDVMWFLSQMCVELGVTFQDVAQRNVDKLRSRSRRGALEGSGDER